MKNKGFYDYLDNNTPPGTEEERQLAALLEEVEALPDPDPGQDYWNNFNSRLQQKLEQTPPQGFFARFALPSGIFATLAATAVVVLMFWPGAESPGNGDPQLANLDNSELSLLVSAFEDPYDVYDTSETVVSVVELADGELDLLLNIYDDGAVNLENFNAEEFMALWETEG